MKADFSNHHLGRFPDTDEDSQALLQPFREELEERYNTITKTFIKYREVCRRENKGHYYHLMGKLCSLFEEHANDALPHFEKAAKFMPNEVDVWNELGDCYLSLNNMAVARHCFDEALRRGPNSWSYRSLSIICRREASDEMCDKLAATNLGVEYAKEALKIDATDSYSWMILGNAYMAHFLATREDALMPSKALQAYVQAEKNNGQFPELYFNKAIAFLYAEDFNRSLESFEESIRRDPIWKLAWRKYYSVRDYLMKISDFCYTKSKVKLRKITQFMQALSRETGSIVSTKFNYKNLDDLVEGVNHGKIILGKVLWTCEVDDSFPFTFGFVDGLSHLIVVTVFNLITGKGVKIGDTVAIPNPNFSNHTCVMGSKNYRFLKIRVDQPKEMTVNGKALPECYFGQSMSITKCI